MSYYVVTEKGQFRDIDEIQADSLLDYLKQEDHQAHSHAPSEEEYESFYADCLEIGEKVLHISISQNLHRQGYSAATAAMRGFNHVTVYDSAHLSSGMGIMVLTAAKMAKKNKSVEEIVDTLNQMKERIATSFIVPSIQTLYRNGLIKKTGAQFSRLFNLHPVLYMTHGRLKCKTLIPGDGDSYYSKYIKAVLRKKKNIDTQVVFITYAGCSLKQLEDFTEEINRQLSFEHVIYQRASATISCNCGIGAMGVLFLRK